jgi:hypothetical protein
VTDKQRAYEAARRQHREGWAQSDEEDWCARKEVTPGTYKSIAEELASFNAERAKLLRNKPLAPGERMPLPFSGVGGDLPGNAGE